MKSILNKILAVILSSVICSSVVLTNVSAATSQYDIDSDGIFDISDSTYLQMHLAGYFKLSDSALKIADANNSGTVDIGDVTHLQMVLAGYAIEENTTKPTQKPTVQPTTQPTTQKPTVQPTTQPTTQKPTVQPTTQPTEDLNKYADEVIRLVNIERAKVGAKPLTKSGDLTEVAQIRSVEATKLLSHIRPNGEAFYFLCIEKGIPFTYIGENLARGQKTPEQAVKAWMDSPPHKSVMLDSRFVQTGVACYRDGNSLYWVQIFVQ